MLTPEDLEQIRTVVRQELGRAVEAPDPHSVVAGPDRLGYVKTAGSVAIFPDYWILSSLFLDHMNTKVQAASLAMNTGFNPDTGKLDPVGISTAGGYGQTGDELVDNFSSAVVDVTVLPATFWRPESYGRGDNLPQAGKDKYVASRHPSIDAIHEGLKKIKAKMEQDKLAPPSHFYG